MKNSKQHRSWTRNLVSSPASAAVAIAIVHALICITSQPAHAQTYTVLHNFTLGGDGGDPLTGLRMDAAGNFYGTTDDGGANNEGTVFKLKYHGSAWILTTLYSFGEIRYDGALPQGRVSIAADGTVYGTTITGESNVGTVFHLAPAAAAPKSALAPWNETILYKFSEQGSDGQEPEGDLLFDQSGNIYGTTFGGGINGHGVIYELTPSGSGWTESVLYAAQNNGTEPRDGVISDAAGNLYGVFAFNGPHNGGAVYELSPSGSGWTEQTVYGFTGGTDGEFPFGGVIMDSAGNLYGTTSSGGRGGGGTVFELTPTNGGWTFNLLYSFSFSGGNYSGPQEKLVMDAAGNLYGTTAGEGAFGYGSVFKLTPSNGGWTYTSLHDFSGGNDGRYPECSLIFDGNGNLYGTASEGGAYGYGVVFEITP